MPEPESGALFQFLNDWPLRVSSELARTEVLRALRRANATPRQFRRGQNALDRIGLIAVDRRILDSAALLTPNSMRSLDAIHLASALSLKADLAAIVTYDLRLSMACRAAGVAVWAPGS